VLPSAGVGGGGAAAAEPAGVLQKMMEVDLWGSMQPGVTTRFSTAGHIYSNSNSRVQVLEQSGSAAEVHQ
jgi:hypothetical protein